MRDIPLENAVVVVGDGSVFVYRGAEQALARRWEFDDWTAWDLDGRRLRPGGGWHRSGALLGWQASIEHGRRLEPSADEAPRPDVVRACLVGGLGADEGEQAEGVDIVGLVRAWIERHGWDD